MSTRLAKSTEDKLTDKQFNVISQIAYSEAGLVLVKAKMSMISARLSKRVKSLRLADLDAYFEVLNSSQRAVELPNLLSTLTTNVSHFFREDHHFRTFSEEIIPDLVTRAKADEKIRIWSAGCSNGQELFSTAIALSEGFPDFLKYDVKLLGTDIDQKVIETAKLGIYEKTQMRGVSSERAQKFFSNDPLNHRFKVNKELLKAVTFRKLNLIQDWPMKHPFDVIFCRNVVIYFDEETQTRLWRRFSDVMKPNSWLFLGHSERIQESQENSFEPWGVTTYRKLK